MIQCKTIGCSGSVSPEKGSSDYCQECCDERHIKTDQSDITDLQSLSEKYPNYYKKVGNLTEIDVYAVHHLFNVQDPSGCIHHSSKKLLLSGVRTGGKSAYKDIKEARDTLNRWLQLNQE